MGSDTQLASLENVQGGGNFHGEMYMVMSAARICWGRVTSLITCIQFWLFVKEYLTNWYESCIDW